MKVDKSTFFRLISTFNCVPFIQSEGWYDYIDSANTVFFVDSEQDPHIAFWGVVTEHRIIGKKLLIDGLCYKTITTQKQITHFFKEIIDTAEYDIVYLSDIGEINPDFQVAFRRSGFIRPIALKLCPMSLLVEFNKEFFFHRNWKRQVTKSVNAGNTFEVCTEPSDEILRIFINLFNELRDRKTLGFMLSVNQLKALLNSNDFFLSLIRNYDGKPLCGRITYLRNNHAYDVFAANSDEALAVGAVYQNQQNLFEYLKSIGAVDFDYGRIPPGRDAMDNIYIAKSYSGGKAIIYNGEWEYTKSNFVNWLYSFYRYCIHKAKRY